MKILRAAALVALGVALALAFVKSTMPMDQEPQTERKTSASDYVTPPKQSGPATKIQLDDGTWQYITNPHWKVEDERGCPDNRDLPCPPMEFERPEPTPEHVRVWCKKNPDYCRRITR